MNEPEKDGGGSRTPAIAGLAIAVVLLAVGLWLAHELTAASKMQDCLMSGRTTATLSSPLDSACRHSGLPRRQAWALKAWMAPAVLAPVVGRRLSTQPIEPVVYSVGSAVHRVDHAVGRNRGAGIEVGRTVIMQVDVVDGVVVPVMPDRHVRIGGK
jgi:hypothetical protein